MLIISEISSQTFAETCFGDTTPEQFS